MHISNKLFQIGFLLIVFMASSCLNNDNEKKREEEEKEIADFAKANGFTEEHLTKSGSGLYLKIIETQGSTDTAKAGKQIVLSYKGYYTNGSCFDASDSLTAESVGIFQNDLVYGPQKFPVNILVSGIYEAVHNMALGDSAQAILPSRLAYKPYEPVVYDLKVEEVINNDTIYEDALMGEFLAANPDFTIFNNNAGFYAKGLGNTKNPEVRNSDSVRIELIGRYAETKGRHSRHDVGRQFYPIAGYQEKLFYELEGTISNFPWAAAIDTALSYMQVDETVEIAVGSRYAYGSSGFMHPYKNISIVPTFIPVHYKITLREIYKEAE